MDVQVIGEQGADDILDLTGGAHAKESQEVEEETKVEEEVTEAEGGVDEEEPSSDADSEEPEKPSGSDNDDSSDDSDSSTDGEDEYYLGDTQVDVEMPDEIGKALEEAGIDSSDILKQLFAKDGDFSLNEETRGKLEDKFGKTIVDGYLNLYKNMNEQAMQKFEADKKGEAELAEAQGKEYAELVGGEEGLIKMEEFALENLNDSQIEAYNSIMEKGDHAAQMLVLGQVKQLMEVTDRANNGDKKVSLLGDKETSSKEGSVLDKGYLSNEEYQTIMDGDKYWEDKDYAAKVDKARLSGIRKSV